MSRSGWSLKLFTLREKYVRIKIFTHNKKHIGDRQRLKNEWRWSRTLHYTEEWYYIIDILVSWALKTEKELDIPSLGWIKDFQIRVEVCYSMRSVSLPIQNYTVFWTKKYHNGIYSGWYAWVFGSWVLVIISWSYSLACSILITCIGHKLGAEIRGHILLHLTEREGASEGERGLGLAR